MEMRRFAEARVLRIERDRGLSAFAEPASRRRRATRGGSMIMSRCFSESIVADCSTNMVTLSLVEIPLDYNPVRPIDVPAAPNLVFLHR